MQIAIKQALFIWDIVSSTSVEVVITRKETLPFMNWGTHLYPQQWDLPYTYEEKIFSYFTVLSWDWFLDKAKKPPFFVVALGKVTEWEWTVEYHEAYALPLQGITKGTGRGRKGILPRDWLTPALQGVKMVCKSFSFLCKERLNEGGQNITHPHLQTKEQTKV